MISRRCSIGSANFLAAFQLRQIAQLVLSQGKSSWWMVLLLWLVAIAPARAELLLRVAIDQDVDQVKVGSSTNAALKDGSGHVLAQIPGMNAVVAQDKAGKVAVNQVQASQLWVEPSDGGYVFVSDKWYRGRTLVVPTTGGLTAVNYVDLEDYLYSVVGSEVYTNWPLEALKAQAVAARTYALYQRQTSSNAVFDIGNTVSWQVYDGMAKEAPSTRAAVDATKGQVLTYNGQIIDAVFHSCSGGYTENVENVWMSPLPYLRGVPSFDQNSPDCQWERTFTADQLRRRVTGVGNIISMTPVATGPSGRVRTMRVTGDSGSRTIDGDDLRNALGLKSTLFQVIPQVNQVASIGRNVPVAPTAFQVRGAGYGHGLGLSQWGAYNLAQQQWNYQQILLHYYTGTSLAKIEVR
jgi:stage II sporulation protein D